MRWKLSLVAVLALALGVLGSSVGPAKRSIAQVQGGPCPPTAPQSFCVLEGHTSFVYAVAFSPDGKLLASGSCLSPGPLEACESGEIRLWEVITGQAVRILRGHRAWILGLAFHPKEQLLASSAEEVLLWDLQTGSIVRTISSGQALEEVQAVAFSPDGRLLASGDMRAVRLWEVATGAPVRVFEVPTWVYDVAFSPNGKLLAAATGHPDKAIRIWEVDSGQLDQVLQKHTDEVLSVAFSPDGKLLASASADTTVRLWDMAKGESVQTLVLHTLPVTSVAFAPNGKLLASGSMDRTIHLWDVATGSLQRTLRGHTGPILAVAFSPDGKLLASASFDQTVRLWYVGDLTGQ